MSRGPDAGTRLARAIEAAGPAVTIIARAATPWASVTFTGARHEMMLDAPASAAFDIWLEGLPEADFAIPGHLVADLAVVGVTRRDGRAEARIEILTVEN